jgi:putative (di)nucleoside polyphosphate hydrolase
MSKCWARRPAGCATACLRAWYDANEHPEFDHWRWVEFWYPAAHVVNFKRRVYEQALRHLVVLAEGSCSVSLREQQWQVEMAAAT